VIEDKVLSSNPRTTWDGEGREQGRILPICTGIIGMNYTTGLNVISMV
jgi:hypothetical protein